MSPQHGYFIRRHAADQRSHRIDQRFRLLAALEYVADTVRQQRVRRFDRAARRFLLDAVRHRSYRDVAIIRFDSLFWRYQLHSFPFVVALVSLSLAASHQAASCAFLKTA